MGTAYDFLLRVPDAQRGYARSQNRQDKSLNILMGYVGYIYGLYAADFQGRGHMLPAKRPHDVQTPGTGSMHCLNCEIAIIC